MTHLKSLLKISAASALTLALTACATNSDNKYTVGVDDDDKFTSETNGASNKDGMMDKDMSDNKMMDAPMVGGAAMYSNKTIVENAMAANNLTTLVAAVKQAELVETLSGPGPFTVFAPTDTAFSLLPAGVASNLMMDENRADLQKVLTAHVIPGTITSSDLMIKLGGGTSFSAQTVSGDTLTFYKMSDGIRVADENGTLARIETADVMQSNGVVHVVSSVLVPK